MTVPAPVTLVTGSARGLGLEVARVLARRGDRVHVTWRTSSAAVERLRAEFGARVHQADLCDAGDACGLIQDVVEQDGRLDHLVHAVGEFVSGPLAEGRADDLRRMLASNVESSFLVFGAAREALRSARGDAVFFGCAGLEAPRARREAALYAAAKSALLVLVRAWALEEARHGVRVNLVSPGIVPHEDAHADTLEPARIARIPFGRAGTPEEVAAAVEFLASPRAGLVTGVDLAIAGGWML